MTKMLVFDMDGTIADLYGYKNWLEYLESEKIDPYVNAEPLINIEQLVLVLTELKNLNWKIAITSWLSKNGSKEYNKKVSLAKKNWLIKYNFPYDELHFVKYGTTKAKCTRKKADFQILIDDNEKILNNWTLGAVIKADENLIKTLETLKKLF